MLRYLSGLVADQRPFTVDVYVNEGYSIFGADFVDADETGIVVTDKTEDVLLPWRKVSKVKVKIQG